MNNANISIIIPLYNKEYCILKTIESITTQDYSDYEIVIVDDGSTDHSVEIVENLNNPKIRVIKKTNGGPSSARNLGVNNATGNWGIFLDADDTLEQGALRLFDRLSKKENQCEFFCGNHYIEDETGKTLYGKNFCEGYVWNNFFAYHAKRIRPRAGAALFSMRLLKQYPYDEHLKRYEDAACVFAIMRNHRAYVTPQPVMTYYRTNSDASKPRKDVSEDYIGHLTYEGKDCWEQLLLYNLYLHGCAVYPEAMRQLYNPQKMYNTKVWICKKIITLLTIIGYIK